MRVSSTFEARGEPESTSSRTLASVLKRKCGSTCACSRRSRASSALRSSSLLSSSKASAWLRASSPRWRSSADIAIHVASSIPVNESVKNPYRRPSLFQNGSSSPMVMAR